jgi:hypothetical protein
MSLDWAGPPQPADASAPPAPQAGIKKSGGIKKYEVGEAGPRAKKTEKTPREAKIAFAIGISLILALIALPILGFLMRETRDKPAARSAPASVASRPAPARASSDGGGGGGGGGGGLGGGGDADPDETVSAPMSQPAYRTLLGLWRFFYENSHRRLGEELVPASQCLPDGALDGASEDVMKSFKLAQLRVRQVPLEGLKILAESPTPAGPCFSYELMARTPAGEVVAHGTIQLGPSGEKFMIVSKLDPPGSFDAPSPAIDAPEPSVAAPPPSGAFVDPGVRIGRLPAPGGAAPPRPKEGIVDGNKDGAKEGAAEPSTQHRGYPYIFR